MRFDRAMAACRAALHSLGLGGQSSFVRIEPTCRAPKKSSAIFIFIRPPSYACQLTDCFRSTVGLIGVLECDVVRFGFESRRRQVNNYRGLMPLSIV